MNKQNIIDAAMQIASGMGTDPLLSPVIDADMTAEDLLPLAFRHAYKELLATGRLRFQDTMRAHTISVVDGEGDLPDGVLTEHLEQAFLPAYPYSDFKRQFPDYNRERLDAILCYWTVNNGLFYTSCVVEESEESDEGSGSEEEDGTDVVLHAVSIPEIPTSAATDIAMPQAALDAVINTLALAIRGDIKLIQ